MDTTLGWAAGFLEGEGSFWCDPTKSLLRVSAPQKDRESLDWISKLFGGSVRVVRRQYKGAPRFIFEWDVSGSRAAGVCMTLYTFMTTRRKAQIREALDRWRSHRPHYRHWLVCKYGHPFTLENTYTSPRGKERRCRICVRERNRGYEAAARHARGSVPRAKLTEAQVRTIRQRFDAGTLQSILCAEYGVAPGTMHHIVHGITWKHLLPSAVADHREETP